MVQLEFCAVWYELVFESTRLAETWKGEYFVFVFIENLFAVFGFHYDYFSRHFIWKMKVWRVIKAQEYEEVDKKSKHRNFLCAWHKLITKTCAIIIIKCRCGDHPLFLFRSSSCLTKWWFYLISIELRTLWVNNPKYGTLWKSVEGVDDDGGEKLAMLKFSIGKLLRWVGLLHVWNAREQLITLCILKLVNS